MQVEFSLPLTVICVRGGRADNPQLRIEEAPEIELNSRSKADSLYTILRTNEFISLFSKLSKESTDLISWSGRDAIYLHSGVVQTTKRDVSVAVPVDSYAAIALSTTLASHTQGTISAPLANPLNAVSNKIPHATRLHTARSYTHIAISSISPNAEIPNLNRRLWLA